MELNNLLESANPYKALQDDASRLSAKWAKTGLLEGMNSEVETNNMSMILENQAKQLVTETSRTNVGGASFTAGDGAQWAGVALPLVRKVFGQIAAKEFVSVQPMNLPSGLVFYLDFQYGTDKGLGNSGDMLNKSLYGTTDTSAAADGGLYGAGRFTYSENSFSSSVAISDSGSANWYSDLNADDAISASAAAGEVFYVDFVTSSIDANLDLKGVKGFTMSTGSYLLTGHTDGLPQYTTTTGNLVRMFYTGSAVATKESTFVVVYQKQPVDNARGDFEAGSSTAVPNDESASEIVIPEINVAMRSEAIVAKTRKLKASWTPEFAQDLNAYHSLDAEAELTSMLSEYIALEIDLEILSMLEESATTTEYWSAVANEAIDSTGIVNSNIGFYNTQGGWFQTLGTKIQKVSNTIHQKTLRGGANFMVISPDIATVIESIPGFASTSDGDPMKKEFAFGLQKAGTLNGRYKVYKNPYQKSNMILMGYRGSQFLETGAVFAPYIPLIMTPLVYDPDTFTPRKGLMTRYAKKMIRPEFYGKVYVSGLNTI
jgi:hypothetical protein